MIVIILLVGGLAFFAGRISSEKNSFSVVNSNFPQENQVVNNTKTDCLSTTKPWVKVLSQNGGETYTAGQQIIVKWESCNNPYTPKQVSVRLSNNT